MEKRSVRIAVFISVFIASLLLATRCTLPNEFLGRVAEAQLDQALNYEYEVDIDKTRLSGLAGVSLKRLQLTSRTHTLPDGAPARIRIPKVKAGVSPFKLIGKTIDAQLQSELGGGKIEVDVTQKMNGPLEAFEARFYDVNLQAIPIIEARYGLPLTGVVRGTVSGGLDDKGRLSSGSTDLNILNITLGPGALSSDVLPADIQRFWSADISIPEVDIGDVLLRAPIKGSQIELEAFRVVGEDLRASGEGRIMLRTPIAQSQIQTSIRVAVEPAFIKEADLGGLLSSIPKLRGMSDNGEILLTLSGPISKPQVSTRATNTAP